MPRSRERASPGQSGSINMALLPLNALEAMRKNDWERLREISLFPGGFGEARAEIWLVDAWRIFSNMN